MFKKSVTVGLAAAALGFLASAANAAVNITLTIKSAPDNTYAVEGMPALDSTVSGTWAAYLTITQDTNETLGLALYSIDVKGANGINIIDWTDNVGAYGTTVFNPTTADGFGGFNNATINNSGDHGVGIAGSQTLTNYKKKANTGTYSTEYSILQGIGLTAQSGYFGAVWDQPFEVATGYYYGANGTLSVNGSFDNDLTAWKVLPSSLPTNPTTAGVPLTYNVFGPAGVVGQTVTIGSDTPEPASLGVLALGGLALLARRRKVA